VANRGSGANPRGRIRVVYGTGSQGPSDAFGQKRPLAPIELVQKFKNAVYVCASVKAGAVASTSKRLYATTKSGENTPRLKTRRFYEVERRRMERYLESNAGPDVSKRLAGVDRVDEVTESPILRAFKKPNPWLTAFQLVELAQLYREIEGRDFWYWTMGPLGIPEEIWPLPSWMVYVQPDFSGTDVVKNYIFTGGGANSVLDPSRLIYGKELNLVDPYTSATSWLRANSQLADIYDSQISYRQSTLRNRGRPDAMLIPKEEGGEVTVDRDAIESIKIEYEQEYSMSGAGRLWVPPGGMELKPVSWSPTDMGEIALSTSVLHDVARAARVPIPLVDGTAANRANMDAALLWFSRDAVRPCCWKLAEHWNAHFITLYDKDDDGEQLERQFIAFDDPVAADRVQEREEHESGLREGYMQTNEVRRSVGLPPVEGGDIIRVPVGYVPLEYANDPTRLAKAQAAGKPADSGSAKLSRGDKNQNGKKRPTGANDKPFAEEDDVGSNNGKKKALEGVEREGEYRSPFAGKDPGAQAILDHALEVLDEDLLTITPRRRYDLLHVIRNEARSYFRVEAQSLTEAILEAQAKPEKRLLGDLRDKAGTFFKRMGRSLREFITAGVLALSGPRSLSEDDRDRIDEALKYHLSFMRKFQRDLQDRGLSTQVADTTPTPYSPDQFAAQAELYGGAVWPSAINFVRSHMIGSIVFSLERRKHIGLDVPCDDCIYQQDLGIVPIGTLDPIGDSVCMSSCHCIFIFYVDADDEQGWIAGRGPLDELAFGER
jgi:HK97 family phage portal protein